MTFAEFREIVRANGIRPAEKQWAQLEEYAALLREHNATVNLISRKDEENIFEKHILHSLTLAIADVTGFAIPQDSKVFDIGTGGGLPGIPLAIVRNDLTITLCDSIVKKIAANNEMIASLGLKNIRTIVSRAEDLAKKKEYLGAFDVVVSRAVAPLDELVKWTKDLLKAGGTLLSLKGGDLSEEIQRTKSMKPVADVTETSLALAGYNDFVKEEKKVVRVTLVS